jgi:hypothetical protein
MVYKITESNVILNIPKECFEFPGGGDERTTSYRKLCFQAGNVYHVAMESKVFKYDHVRNYATFTVDSNMVACLQEFKSLSISYEYEEETSDRECTISTEILQMLPFGCVKMTISNKIKDQFGALAYGPNIFEVCSIVPNLFEDLANAEKMFVSHFEGATYKE